MGRSVAPPASTPLWQCQGAPRGAQAVMIWVVAACLVAGGAAFGAMIDIHRSPWYGAGVGLLMAGLLVLGMRRGTALAIHPEGVCTYWVAGKANCSIPLNAIQSVQMVAAGNLRGVGVVIEAWERIVWHHKSGISFTSMRAMRAALGVDIVFEYLGPEAEAQLRTRCREALHPVETP